MHPRLPHPFPWLRCSRGSAPTFSSSPFTPPATNPDWIRGQMNGNKTMVGSVLYADATVISFQRAWYSDLDPAIRMS